MARTLGMISLAAALLLLAAAQTQAWAAAVVGTETDMVPVSPAERVMVAIAPQAAPVCLQCRCCSKSNPSQCDVTSCCSTFNCDPAGKCHLVPQHCGCNGC